MLRAVSTPSYNAVIGSPKAYGAQPKVAILGDSITYQNNDCGSTTQLINEAQGYMTWLNALSNQRYYFPVAGANDVFTAGNYGVSGERLDAMKVRLSPVLEYNPDIVIFLGGTNDLVNTARTYAQMTADAQTIIETFTSRGIFVAVMPILPRSVWSSLTAGEILVRRRVQYNYNTWLKKYARTNRLVGLADPTRDWIDQASANGDPLAEVTKDSLHPSPMGAYYMGKALARVLNPLFPPAMPSRVSSILDVYEATDNPQGNLVINGLMAGTAGTNGTGSSGTVADNWTASRTTGATLTGVCSKTTLVIDEATNQTAVAQRIVLATAGAGATGEAFRLAPSATISSTVAAGDRVYMECVIKMSGVTGNLIGIVPELNVTTSGTTELVRDLDRHQSPAVMPRVTETLTLRTPEWTLPATLTYIRPLIYIYLDCNVAGGVTVDIAEITIRKVV